jgi:hypothetical protein
MLNISGFFDLENGNQELKSDLKHLHMNSTTMQTCKSSIFGPGHLLLKPLSSVLPYYVFT